MSLTILIPVKNESQIIEKTIFALENSWIKEIDHEIKLENEINSEAEDEVSGFNIQINNILFLDIDNSLFRYLLIFFLGLPRVV